MPNPYTDTCRPIGDLIAEAATICNTVGVPAHACTGTTLKRLVYDCSTALTESAGEPTCVIVYGGSWFDNCPRRTTTLQLVILSSDTRVVDGVAAAVAAARTIAAAMDDTIHNEAPNDNTITDKWEVASEEVLDLPGLADTAAVSLSVTIKDY